MKVYISKSCIKGQLSAPPSKSYTIRGLFCASLARGTSRIINPLVADDTEAAAEVIGKMGTGLEKGKGEWSITGGNLIKPKTKLFCQDSAATLRFAAAVCSLIPGRCQLMMGASLARRPIKPLLDALKQLGADYRLKKDRIIIKGRQLKGNTIELPGEISSQFISGLLIISPLLDNGLEIRTTSPPTSAPYIRMTLDCMSKFGIEVKASYLLNHFMTKRRAYLATTYIVEGDWSSVSCFLAMGAVSGSLEINSLNPNSFQADRIMIDLINRMGVETTIKGNSIRVISNRLKPIEADLSNCIDLLPALAALASLADGTSVFIGIKRARLKESDRVAAIKEGLDRMGVKVVEEENKLAISGGNPHGALIDSHDDHRIAMAFAILGIAVGDTVIDNAECVSKTYPRFWWTLKSVGGEVKKYE